MQPSGTVWPEIWMNAVQMDGTWSTLRRKDGGSTGRKKRSSSSKEIKGEEDVTYKEIYYYIT